MNIALSADLRNTIRNILERTEREGAILDAYAAANEVQDALPNETVDLEDIVVAFLEGRGGIQAIELSPPALILEICVPLPDCN